jgi:hypothetical protein
MIATVVVLTVLSTAIFVGLDLLLEAYFRRAQ